MQITRREFGLCAATLAAGALLPGARNFSAPEGCYYAQLDAGPLTPQGAKEWHAWLSAHLTAGPARRTSLQGDSQSPLGAVWRFEHDAVTIVLRARPNLESRPARLTLRGRHDTVEIAA